jgi:hypothetical protein
MSFVIRIEIDVFSRCVDTCSLRIKVESFEMFNSEPPMRNTVNPGYCAALPRTAYRGNMEILMFPKSHLSECCRAVNEVFERSKGSMVILRTSRMALYLVGFGTGDSQVQLVSCLG